MLINNQIGILILYRLSVFNKHRMWMLISPQFYFRILQYQESPKARMEIAPLTECRDYFFKIKQNHHVSASKRVSCILNTLSEGLLFPTWTTRKKSSRSFFVQWSILSVTVMNEENLVYLIKKKGTNDSQLCLHIHLHHPSSAIGCNKYLARIFL